MVVSFPLNRPHMQTLIALPSSILPFQFSIRYIKYALHIPQKHSKYLPITDTHMTHPLIYNIITSFCLQNPMESKKIKIVIVGHSGVGKTSIIHRYIYDNGDLNVIEPTLGAVYHEKQQQLKDGERVTFQIWDTAGQERYRSIAKIYYKDARVVLAVYDVTSPQSFEEMKHWIDEVKTNSSKTVRLVLVGNKTDLIENVNKQIQGIVNHQEAKMYANSLKAPLRTTSATDNKGIQELFDLVGEKATEAVIETNKQTETKRVRLEEQKKEKQLQKKKGCCV